MDGGGRKWRPEEYDQIRRPIENRIKSFSFFGSKTPSLKWWVDKFTEDPTDCQRDLDPTLAPTESRNFFEDLCPGRCKSLKQLSTFRSHLKNGKLISPGETCSEIVGSRRVFLSTIPNLTQGTYLYDSRIRGHGHLH